MRGLFRFFGWLLSAAIWLVAAALAVTVAYRVLTMPKTGGELLIPGLKSELSITRDNYGVAHVRAASPAQAHYGLGFVHGQDRLWQLEMHRRIGRGALSEVLGAATLPTDKFLRTLGVHVNAKRIWDKLDADTKLLVQAYVDGINASIALTRESPVLLSPEFFILNTRPVAWEPTDVIAWQTMMAWDLSSNMHAELMRFDLSTKLSPERLSQLMDTEPAQALPNLGELYAGLLMPSSVPAKPSADKKAVYSSESVISQFLGQVPFQGGEGIGSNSWIVTGAKSTTGKPLLANDPHLTLSTPALWYLAHLSAPGLDVIGGTVPGLPYVLAGRTENFAWGLTTSSSDIQDLYLERISSSNPLAVDAPEGQSILTVRQEVIAVKGQEPVNLSVRTSRHGPIISDSFEPLAQMLKQGKFDKSYVMALKWAALTDGDFTVRAGVRVNRAKNWLEFNEAFSDFQFPPQNVSFADTQGKTALVIAGRVPKRKSVNKLTGLAPGLGWDANYDWEGIAGFDALPKFEDLSLGYLGNGNNNIVPEKFGLYLGSEWAMPYRAKRIEQLLAATPKHDVQSMKLMQTDRMSLLAKELLPVLVATKPTSSPAQDAIALLAAWDLKEQGFMRGDRPEPLILATWIDHLRRELFSDELGPAQVQAMEKSRTSSRALVRALTQKEYAPWCDDVRTIERETCDQALAKSLDSALAVLTKKYGSPMQQWRYDKANIAISEHRPFGKHGVLSKIFDLRTPFGGDTFSVNVGKNDPWHPSEPQATRWGASYRAVYDLADLNKSQFIQSSGQSGHRFSPHYGDLNELWANNQYLPMLTDRALIDKNAQSLLVLKPSP